MPQKKKAPRSVLTELMDRRKTRVKAPKDPKFRGGGQPALKKFGLLQFDSFRSAKVGKDRIVAACEDCDQLNLVIREEGNMDDEELLSLNPKIKMFAGDAWYTIHQRRLEEGWYTGGPRSFD